MLEQILQYLHNWFVKDIYQVTNLELGQGDLALPFLQEKQWYRIIGSTFNDGLYQYGYEPDGIFEEETFTGVIWALAIPREIQQIAVEIEEWCEKNANIMESPYQSESFGGYSYQRSVNSGGKAYTWSDVFANRLSRWRKI